MMKNATLACVFAMLSMGLTVGVPAEDRVCMEAESAESLEIPVERVDATKLDAGGTNGVVKDASGNGYIEIAQGKGNPPAVTTGAASYEFEVAETGEYVFWCRVWWEDECGNSFSVNLNAAAPFVFGQDGTFKSWHWVKGPARLKQLTLSKGKQKLKIQNREDGVKIDQILLTTDVKFVPVGIEPVSVEVKPTEPAPAEKP